MTYFLLFVLAVVLLILGGHVLLNADVRTLAKWIRMAGSIGLFGLAGLLLLAGRWAVALPLALAGLLLLNRRAMTRKSPRQDSRVRTSLIEMALDHDSGRMSGRVLAGEFEGRALDDLDLVQLAALYETALAVRDQSADLLEAYLDRAHEGWTDHKAFEDILAGRTERATADSGPMSPEEALEVLGLDRNASDDDIKAAHKTLMKKVHPDVSGSEYLATKINEAKDTLLKR
jgi:DnaJ-domain-containing protein 1